jgi:restriction endonuclease Mrr
MAIQCKRYAQGHLISATPIRSLAGVLDRFHAHAGAIVTTSDFTKPAKKEAAAHFWKLNLMNFQGIVEALQRAELVVRPPVTFSPDRAARPSDTLEMYLVAVNVQRV